jgi:hypothetical protein
MKRYLDICSWTKCGDKCPSDKQNVLTWDAGGSSGQGDRCDDYDDGSPFSNPMPIGDASDATKGTKGKRKLCCPKKDPFTGCLWKNKKVCSEQCDAGQITLDLDPQGQGGRYCDNGEFFFLTNPHIPNISVSLYQEKVDNKHSVVMHLATRTSHFFRSILRRSSRPTISHHPIPYQSLSW